MLSGGDALAVVASNLGNRFAAADVALPGDAGRAEAAQGINARHFFVAGKSAAEIQAAGLADVLPAAQRTKRAHEERDLTESLSTEAK